MGLTLGLGYLTEGLYTGGDSQHLSLSDLISLLRELIIHIVPMQLRQL